MKRIRDASLVSFLLTILSVFVAYFGQLAYWDPDKKTVQILQNKLKMIMLALNNFPNYLIKFKLPHTNNSIIRNTSVRKIMIT